MRRLVLLIGVLALWSPISSADVWTVEKDGSGDYTIIQDAVDAAASGDTIFIGPGRFTDQQVRMCRGETDSVRIFVPHDVLTIIGSGPEETIIGPTEAWDLTKKSHIGVFVDSYCGNNVIFLVGMRFENMGYGLYAGPGVKSTIQNCVFADNWYSMDVMSDTTRISDCRFDGIARDGVFVISFYQKYFQMDNCSCSASPDNPYGGGHLIFEGAQVANINQCSFYGGYAGINAAGLTHVTAQNCVFSQQRGFGVAFENSGVPVATLKDCTFSAQYLAFRQDGGYGRWEIEGTTVTDVTLATLGFGNLGGGYIRDCILARGENYVVMDYLGLKKMADPDVHFDMTDNWWGTDNPDSIQAWIFDGNDDPESGYIIDWQPYKGEPVETEKKSLGSFRAMFR